MAELWGAAAARRESEGSLNDEDHTELLPAMRESVGPFASDEPLLRALREAKGKLRWAGRGKLCTQSAAQPAIQPAVSGYFRDQILAMDAACDGCQPPSRAADYLPHPPTTADVSMDRGEASASVASSDELLEGSTVHGSQNQQPQVFMALPEAAIMAVLALLEHRDLCAVACTHSYMRQLASADILWRTLYHRQWSSSSGPHKCTLACKLKSTRRRTMVEVANVTVVNVHVMEDDCGEAIKPIQGFDNEGLRRETFAWKVAFAQRSLAQQQLACFRCSALFVPVVYGFPSDPLVARMRAGQCYLGGDDVGGHDAVWWCPGCRIGFTRWPNHNWARLSSALDHLLSTVDRFAALIPQFPFI
eukprot:jgi/Chlat1/5890/Chrsp4S06385